MINISEKTYEHINNECLRPISRQQLAARWAFLWMLVLFFILIGSTMFSIVFFGLFDYHWETLQKSNPSSLESVLVRTHTLWLICALTFAILIAAMFRITSIGYHYKKRWLLLASLFLSLLLGFILQLAGWGSEIDRTVDDRIDRYSSVPEREMLVWDKPERGFLAGRIIDSNGQDITVQDTRGRSWLITVSAPMDISQINNADCELVKLIGDPGENNTFIVKDFIPWQSTIHPCPLNLK